jgi:hypothetical protein
MAHKFVYLIVRIQRFFFKKGTPEHYKLTYLLEDITDEEYRYNISKLMNKTWDVWN